MEFDETRRMVSRAMLEIRQRSPFFATLALFAQVEVVQTLPTAATDGKRIFVNPEFLRGLTKEQRAGLILHEVLHAALLHVPRRGKRDPLLWNIAADVVVNGIIAKTPGFDLPEGGIREPDLEHLSVEEVYHALMTDPSKRDLIASVYLMMGDLMEPTGDLAGALGEEWRAKLEDHWQRAMQQAQLVQQAMGQGTSPAGLQREMGMIGVARIDWRSHLWRFLVQTPTDFQGFDRRFIGRGYYLESLQGESVRVAVAVDTSGSVGGTEMNLFLSEVQGILGAYPHVRCDLYYADAACYGPYPLTERDPIPPPVGGGGTDFRPFFEQVEQEYDSNEPLLCVYLTDGYGSFPDVPPAMPVLWVVTPGGINLGNIPFGESVRLLED